jgi:hypothetical protein
MAKTATPKKNATRSEFVTQTHPLYDEWLATWILCGENYEGDGGYLTGNNIIGHPREYDYEPRADGSVDYSSVIGIKEKLRRRRQIARYDNFAQALIDVFVDHQYAKAITRTFVKPNQPNEDYLRWIENVDGEGTHLDDWLKEHQTLAHTYGHVMVLMDRDAPDPTLPRSRANQGALVLRDYIPPDCLDWLAPRKQLTAVKLVEAVEREDLTEPSNFSSNSTTRGGATGDTRDDVNLEYLFVDTNEIRIYDANGSRKRLASHGFGELPVVPFYSRRRARIPVLGRPLLRDPRLFRDHFNLVSELRELLRSQTFSMLNIQLGPDEDVEAARARLGQTSGTDTVLFTLGGASFVAPADGPAATLAQEIENVERKMYRLLGLPWEGDSRDAEAAESRRIKANDLNRTLAGHADETQKFDYQIARLFYIGYYGRQQGLREWLKNPPVIKHPDEFNTEEILAIVEDIKAALGLQLGKTAETLLRKQAVPVVLKDLDAETRQTIDREIDATPYNPATASGVFDPVLPKGEGAADNPGT